MLKNSGHRILAWRQNKADNRMMAQSCPPLYKTVHKLKVRAPTPLILTNNKVWKVFII